MRSAETLYQQQQQQIAGEALKGTLEEDTRQEVSLP
jgi:hypothetical protein